MLKRWIYILLSITALNSSAQNIIGLSSGIVTKQTTSPQMTTKTNEIILWSRSYDDPRIFIAFYFETGLLKKYRVKQELSIYQSSHVYELLVPTNDPNSNFTYFNPVAHITFTTVNYRSLIQFIKRHNFSFKVGPSLDFDFVKVPYTKPPYFSPDYPEAAELEKSLEDGFNPVTLYADVEVNYNWKRFDFAVSYKYSLTSQTGKFVYDGNQHSLRSTSTQLFVRLGYRFFVKEKNENKQN